MNPRSEHVHPAGGDGFSPGVAEQLGYYVYLLSDPRDDQIFYVGKGTGGRCFAHVAEARKTQADARGDYEKLALIREVQAAGLRVRIELLRHGLDEEHALLLESTVIDLLGLASLANRVGGHGASALGRMSLGDIEARYARPVQIDPSHRVVLIRLNHSFERAIDPTALYEVTRGWWKVGGRARRLDSLSAPQWAMAVFCGVVRAVYRIEGWEQPTLAQIEEDPVREGRWGFFGRRDAALESRYLHGDVSAYLRSAEGVASQNPIRYVGCAR